MGMLTVLLLSSSLFAQAYSGRPAEEAAGENQPDVVRILWEASTEQMHLAGEASIHEEGYAALREGASIQLDIPLTQAQSCQVGLRYRIPEQQRRAAVVQMTVGTGEATRHELSPAYTYTYGADGKMEQDAQGNDILPEQNRAAGFLTAPLRLPDYLQGETYAVDFAAGTNTVTLTIAEGELEVASVFLFTAQEPAAYTPPADAGDNREILTIEAEYPSLVSDTTLMPVADRASAQTTPSDASHTRLNTIGGSGWTTPGQWVQWTFEVEKAGYYAISMRVRQNLARGMQSTRRILIDGEVPCRELEAFKFQYDRGWQVVTLGDEEQTYYFYLDEGEHTLTMEALMADAVPVYTTLQDAIQSLNELYLQIIKITGTSPDSYRTYNLHTAIPNLVPDMQRIVEQLETLYADYQAISGGAGSELSFISEVVGLLERYIEDTDTIITTLSTFNSDISTMSTVLNALAAQPLQVDRLELTGAGTKTSLQAESGFFSRLWYGVQQFFRSFTEDYGAVGATSASGGTLDVWISSGRDQANALKTMIDDTFTPQYQIGVRLSLVSSGLVEATMAGRGPDVALGVARTYPMDLGARGVLMDLSEFEGFDAIRERFQASAFNAYTYKDKVFGLPETQDFLMMFVREDVFSRLGLTVPKTWDDFMGVITLLSQEHMTVGVPTSSIGTRLVQAGMTYYNEGFTSTTLSSEEAYQTYAEFIKLYQQYEQPFAYSAGNRFKTGEMPLVIDYLSFYSVLAVLAPEISGQWGLYPIPGTVGADGTVNNASDATGVAAVLFKSCENPEAGFTFLDWWTSADVQARYGTALENQLGPSGRYLTANEEAATLLPWSAKELTAITAQREVVSEIPEIPGSYIVSRNLTNIFYDIINNNANIRESLLRYSRIIDEELESKQAEMDLLEEE